VLWSQQKKKALAKLVDLLAELLDFNSIKDPGFWKWWEQNKGSYGPFDNSHEGFNPEKPFDLPNREMAETMRQEYEQCKTRDSGRGGKTRGGRPNINEILRGGGRGGGGRWGSGEE
jgi:hypothetical protein